MRRSFSAIIISKFRRFFRYIFVGALSLFPLILVLIVVNFIKNLGFTAYIKLHDYTDSYLGTALLIIGVLVAFALLGLTIERYGRSVLVSWIDYIIEKIPAISTIYSVTKKIANMLSGKDETGKKEVVLVEYPKADIWVPAYVLNRHHGVCVLFVPTSPNPTSGYTILIKESLTLKVSMTLEEASAFIISMGADFAKQDEIARKIMEHHRSESA